MSPRVWVVLGLVASAACGPQAAPRPSPGEQLAVTPDGQLMTVHATAVPRSVLLNELARYGIQVRAYDVPDAPVTVSRENVQILVGVAALFPPGSRFVIRLGERELDEPSLQQGQKEGEPPRPEPGLFPKGKGPEPKRTVLKAKPTEKPPPPQVGVPGLKPDAKSIAAPPPGLGPKLAKAFAQPDSSLQLTFTITATGEVTLVSRGLVEGTPPASTIVEGPFLVVLRDAGGAVVFAQAQVDPLEQHSYLPDGTHDLGRASEGTFSVLLPPAAGSRLATGTLEFIDARDVTLPTRLDPKTLDRTLREAKPIAKFPGDSLVEPVNQPR